MPNQSQQENLTLVKVVLIKKLVLLPPKALTQVLSSSFIFSQFSKILHFCLFLFMLLWWLFMFVGNGYLPTLVKFRCLYTKLAYD